VAAGSSRPGSAGEHAAAERSRADVDATLEALLGRTVTELEQRRAELALAAEVRARLQAEVEHLEHRLHDAEVERSDLIDKLTHRDRLLGQIFSSRSWRWTQALRRMLRRP
jgi:hypothetical protein